MGRPAGGPCLEHHAWPRSGRSSSQHSFRAVRGNAPITLLFAPPRLTTRVSGAPVRTQPLTGMIVRRGGKLPAPGLHWCAATGAGAERGCARLGVTLARMPNQMSPLDGLRNPMVNALRFQSFTLDLDRLSLRGPSGDVDLRPKSFEVLRYLVEHAGRVVTKDEVIKAVWPDVTVTDESLTRCVSEVRRAIGDDAQQMIKTVSRRGYLFDSTLAREDAEHARNADSTLPSQQSGAPLC